MREEPGKGGKGEENREEVQGELSTEGHGKVVQSGNMMELRNKGGAIEARVKDLRTRRGKPC